MIFYSEDGAKGNVYMESFNGHFKCPKRLLFCEASSLAELRVIVEERVDYWNTRRRHTTLQNWITIDYVEARLEDGN